MGSHTLTDVNADSFVREYLRLLDEGWEPDLEEYLHRIPTALREEVYQGIDTALANPPEIAEESCLEPQTELVAEPAPVPEAVPLMPGLSARCLARLMPRTIRQTWLADWLLARRDRAEIGLPPFEVNLLSLQEMFQGLAQHAPLRTQLSGVIPVRLARFGWTSWRCSGLVMFAGTLAGSAPAIVAGLACMTFAFYAAVRQGEDPCGWQLVNSVMGGTIVAVLSAVALATATLPLLAIGGVALAAKSYAVCLTFALFAITAAGWVPDPWYPRR